MSVRMVGRDERACLWGAWGARAARVHVLLRMAPPRMSRPGETDAILRRIWGYGRIFDDPPRNPTETRLHVGALILGEIRDLHTLLQGGEFLPEVWDSAVGFKYRDREFNYPVVFVYAPGVVGPAPCSGNGGCRWIDDRAPVTACTRCHTIRHRQDT